MMDADPVLWSSGASDTQIAAHRGTGPGRRSSGPRDAAIERSRDVATMTRGAHLVLIALVIAGKVAT